MMESGSSRTEIIARGLGIGTISLAAFLFLGLLFTANRGLDYSDVSYSYLWARYPFEYMFTVRLSGFFLHPIELLVQHSMTGFRVVGMLLTAAGGILIAIIALNATGRTPGRMERGELIAACGIGMFLGNIYWMNTPSYQHMAVWGLALVLAGFAVMIRKSPASTAQILQSAFFIALGGLVLAFSKIPSAMGAAALTLGVVLFAHDGGTAARLRMLGLIALTEIVLLAATATLISPWYIFGLLQEGLALRKSSGGLLDVLGKHLIDVWNMPVRLLGIFLISAASLWMTLAATSQRRVFGLAPLPAALVLGGVATSSALLYVNPVRLILSSYNPYFHGLRMTALAFAVLGLASAVYRYRHQNIGRERLLLAILLIVAPWIASLGTGNNFLQHTALYSGFSGLAIIIVTMEMPKVVAQTIRLVVVLMSAATLYFAALHPFRLNKPIAEQNVPVALNGLNGGTLLLDAPTAQLVRELHDRARAAGLAAGTPLFDLAGHGPGFNLALGTKPPVYPWIAAGYPGSPGFLDKIWSLTSEADRKRAWVIGPVHQSFDGAAALSELLPLDLNYELILKTAEPQSGMSIELWRPRNTGASRL